MKLKLIDIVGEVERNVIFGTCEFCMSTGDLYYDNYIVEDENSRQHVLTDGYWDWGDWMPILDYCDREINIIDLAEWVSQQDFEADEYGEYVSDFFSKLQQHIWNRGED